MNCEASKTRSRFPKKNKKMQEFYACGKLLLTGEYLVLRGALALAVPTRFGQRLSFEPSAGQLSWRSFDCHNECWLEAEFSPDARLISSSHPGSEAFVHQLLKAGLEISGKPLPTGTASARLEFERQWGLGSSSTLTYLVARLLGTDPMELFFATQNGSGYDVAIAGECRPILYSLSETAPSWEPAKLPAIFEDSCLVHLNRKQRSDLEVNNFRQKYVSQESIGQVSEITRRLIEATSKPELQDLLKRHEDILAKVLQVSTIQQRLFPDFKGSLKSLGAWGGDFIWAFGEDAQEYFHSKGYLTSFRYKDLVK